MMINNDILKNDYSANLFKYRCFDCYTESLLHENQFFFSSPKNFNDPIDCKFEIRYDLGSYKSIYSKHFDYLSITKPYLSRKDRKTEATIMAQNIMKNINNIELRKELKEKLFSKIDNSMGVCSFSGINDSMLLWSHYSSSHKGFCVKINYQSLLHELEQLYGASKILTYLIKKVNYVDKYLTLNPYTTDEVFLQIQLFITKMKCWEYENEYRVIIPGFVNSKISFSDNIFESIYLGANVSRENSNRILEIIKKKEKKIPIYFTHIIDGNIIFKPLENSKI